GLAFVGGSLVPIGGHNVLEPASLGTPVLVGPHTFNFEEITASLIEQGGALRVPDSAALADAVLQLLCDDQRRRAMGLGAQQVFERERGAVGRLMRLIATQLQG
ncbi:MAG: 3-deoxy-D-manno-octulosonic acid transferase, partial [Xanthomonadaceae bacterium]|nr:3-deoxy-D-manno-octulosonic acid transferase [Xanthomonadaceae bacterium]